MFFNFIYIFLSRNESTDIVLLPFLPPETLASTRNQYKILTPIWMKFWRLWSHQVMKLSTYRTVVVQKIHMYIFLQWLINIAVTRKLPSKEVKLEIYFQTYICLDFTNSFNISFIINATNSCTTIRTIRELF